MPDARLSPAGVDGANPGNGPRVLIVRLGAMGDVIHALPAVALLRQVLPEARIGWLIEERWRELLCAPGVQPAGDPGEKCPPGRPLVDEVHLVDIRAWRKRPFSPSVQRSFLSAIAHVRSRRYDCALEMQGAIKSALLARLSGARLVVGFQHPREALARLGYGKRVETRAAHVIDQNLELARAWLEMNGLPRSNACLPPDRTLPTDIPLLPRHALSEARIDSVLESMGLAEAKLAILNPGAGWAAKQWSPARYGALAMALAARGLTPVVNYGPEEDILASEVAVFSRGIARPLPTTLSEFIALARRAHLFVGGDTGPMHQAALLGVKTLAVFGPTDPARNGPYWAATRTLRDPASTTSYSHRRTSDPGLEKLSVERVLAEVDALLQAGPQG